MSKEMTDAELRTKAYVDWDTKNYDFYPHPRMAFCDGWDAARANPDPRVEKFIEKMRELGQAMPPNAVSMQIQRALAEWEKGK